MNMPDDYNGKHFKLWTPVTDRIEVQSHLDESWTDRLGGCLAEGYLFAVRKKSSRTKEIGVLEDFTMKSGFFGEENYAAFSNLTAQTLNSGILAIGSCAGLVNTLAQLSTK